MERVPVKPTVCGRCGASLKEVPGHDERLDRDGYEVVGFLECPACGQPYVYQRPFSRIRRPPDED